MAILGNLLLFSFVALPEEAWSRHLVIDLENVLVQQIPYSQYKVAAKKNQLFQVKQGDRFVSFYVNDLALEWINNLLSRDEITLSLISERDSAFTDSMLTSIVKDLKKNILAKKGKVLTSENMSGGVHDLLLIDADLKDLIYITHLPKKVSALQQSRVLDLGASFFKFESWDNSEAARAGAKAEFKSSYASSEEAWKKDVFKVPLLGNIFKNKIYSPDVAVLKSQLNKNWEQQIPIGSAILQGKKTETLWTISAGKALTGCGELNLITDKNTPYSWKKCLELMPHSIDWKLSADGSKASSCSVKNADGVISAALPVETCLSDKIKTFWKGKTQTECAYYTDEFALIAQASPGDCGSKHLLKDPKSNKPTVVEYFEGMEKLEIKEIFTRLFDRPMSFRKDLMDDKTDPMESQITPACHEAIRSVYSSGKDFSSQLLKERITTVSKLSLPSRRNDLIFYHYTNSASVGQLAVDNNFLEFFKFYRTQVKVWWLYLFYVAEDPVSSRGYGGIQVRVFMKPETRILSEFGNPNPPEIRQQVVDEMTGKYPQTSVCRDSDYLKNLSLYYLAVEDSGADMIQYWNNMRSTFVSSEKDLQYFQILNPGAIDHVEQGVSGQW